MTKAQAVLEQLNLAGSRGVHGFDLKQAGGDRYAARINDLKRAGHQIHSIPERRGRAMGCRYFLGPNNDLPKAHIVFGVFEKDPYQPDRKKRPSLAEGQESLPEATPRPVKMPPVWESLRSKLGPHFIKSAAARSSNGADESTALVQELSQDQDLASAALGEVL